MESSGEQFWSVLNGTFSVPFSENDPNGTMQYCLWTVTVSGALIAPNCAAVNASHPGWKQWTGQVFSSPGNHTFGVTVNNTGGTGETLSGLSCKITLDSGNFNHQNQCGIQPFPTKGISAIVVTPTKPGEVGNITLRWLASTEETISPGNWSYMIRAGPGIDRQNETSVFRIDRGELGNLTDFLLHNATPDNGQYNRTFQPLGLGLEWAWFSVSARANEIHWYTNGSACAIGVHIGTRYATAVCGNIGRPDVSAVIPEGGVTTPQFPMLNVSALATGIGVDTGALAYLLGAGMVVGAGLVGFVRGGPVAAALLAVVGLGFAALLNLVASWWLVIIFMLAFAAILFSPGGNET